MANIKVTPPGQKEPPRCIYFLGRTSGDLYVRMPDDSMIRVASNSPSPVFPVGPTSLKYNQSEYALVLPGSKIEFEAQ